MSVQRFGTGSELATPTCWQAYGDLGWNIGCALERRNVTEPIRKTRKPVR